MAWLQSFFTRTQDTETKGTASALEVITYVVSLASTPRSIDPILDNFRLLTARLQPGQPLSQESQKALVGIYHQLETYLIKNEPLRIFDSRILSDKIHKRFPQRNPAETTFWKGILQE